MKIPYLNGFLRNCGTSQWRSDMNSQNLRFRATVPDEEVDEHPPGISLARRLANDLDDIGWCSGELDNWRDCGWSFRCRRGESDLEVVVCRIDDGEWMLQAYPFRMPGLLRQAFGGQPSATPQDIYDLATAIHNVLASAGWLIDPKWRWDGFPSDDQSTPTPTLSPSTSVSSRGA